MTLDDELRLGIEKVIDQALRDPDDLIERIHGNLISQEIEPKLDVVVSHFSGYLYGWVSAYYEGNYDRFITLEELADFNELMARRASEIKEAFSKTFER